MSKRLNYETWQQTFINMAQVIAKRSKDPSTQVGACIVSKDNKILALGYNGFPNGCNDDSLPWTKSGDFKDTKYAYVVHAELNAILNASVALNNSDIYVTLFPCNECAKAIIQSGIKSVYYLDDKNFTSDICRASRRMFDLAGIEYIKLEEEHE